MNLSEIKNKLKKIKRTTFGISIPGVRKLAKQIAKDDYRKFLDEDDFSSFELKLLHAFVIGYAKDDIQILLQYFQNFIPYATSWVLTDSLCQNFKQTRQHKEEVWRFLMKYKNSNKEFESRMVAVMLLSHYLSDKEVDKVIRTLNELKTNNYYSQMGVAWAIATIMGKYPQKCLNYLTSKNCCLDKKTFRKSLQKIRESSRIPKTIKNLTSNLTSSQIHS